MGNKIVRLKDFNGNYAYPQVKSKGIVDMDTVPTSGSSRAVTSGGVKQYVDEQVADGSVTTSRIADGAVTTSKIQDVAVTGAKLASQSVSSAKIKDRTIGASKLGANSVTTEKIQPGAVTKEKLADDIAGVFDVFKPVQVNDNKSGATDAAQLAEIKAYAARLAACGVDTTKGYEIPILYNGGSKGFIGYNPNAASSFNGYAVTPEGNLYTLTMNATTGALTHNVLATTTITNALSTNKQPKTDAALKTTSKTVTGAINEVNDKTAYVAFTDVTKLSTNLGRRLIYKGGNVTLASPVTINPNIYEIDFNGATITIGALAKTGITAVKGHGHCFIRNLVINGTWTVNADAVSNVLETFAGVENVSVDVNFSGSKYGRGFFSCQRLINCKAEITSNQSDAVTRGFSYCEYLYMCRIGEGSEGEGFFHCTNMISCDALAVVNASGTGITMGCFRKELIECSNYTNFRRRTNEYISDKEVTYGFFSDTDSLSVNGYSLTPFANTIAAKNEDDTKALVHPAGGTGVAEVPLNTTASGNSIARRLGDGRLKAAAATASDDVVVKSQLDVLAAKITELQTEINALKG